MWGEANTYRDYIRSTNKKLEELSQELSLAQAAVAATCEVPTRPIRRSARLARRASRA